MTEYVLRSDYATVIAMDQHARSVTLAALDLSSGETRTGRLVNCPSAGEIVEWAGWATRPLRFAYESGPCGYQLARDIRSAGCCCDVIAVKSIPRSVDVRRVKDDKRDAQSLLEAVLAPNSSRRTVYLPSEEAEAARDLCRAHYDMVAATKRLKMQTSGMLLRHGYVWNERTSSGSLRSSWTRDYVKWAKSARMPDEAANQALAYYLKSVLDGIDRCAELKRSCLGIASGGRFKPYVDALTRLKGVDRMVALTYVATMDDFSRSHNGRSVSKYFGPTPSLHDSGEKTGRTGHIAKAGDTTVRRAVIEGLASLPKFNKSQKRMPKDCGVSAAVEAEACLCNVRNVERYRALTEAGKRPNVAKVAAASELVRQMWVLGGIVDEELAGSLTRPSIWHQQGPCRFGGAGEARASALHTGGCLGACARRLASASDQSPSRITRSEGHGDVVATNLKLPQRRRLQRRCFPIGVGPDECRPAPGRRARSWPNPAS